MLREVEIGKRPRKQKHQQWEGGDDPEKLHFSWLIGMTESQTSKEKLSRTVPQPLGSEKFRTYLEVSDSVSGWTSGWWVAKERLRNTSLKSKLEFLTLFPTVLPSNLGSYLCAPLHPTNWPPCLQLWHSINTIFTRGPWEYSGNHMVWNLKCLTKEHQSGWRKRREMKLPMGKGTENGVVWRQAAGRDLWAGVHQQGPVRTFSSSSGARGDRLLSFQPFLTTLGRP